METHTAAKALGITDAVTTCDCCGKVDLKCTVEIELAGGEVVHYGRTCASRNTGKSAPVINAEIKAHALAQKIAAQREFRAHPAYLAERARFAERDRQAPRPIGMAAAEFVRAASDAADAACKAIAARFAVSYWEVR